MLLYDFFRTTYAPRKLRGKSPATIRLYGFTIAGFGRTLQKRPELSDLTDDNLLLHMARRIDVQPATRNKELSQLCALWRYAVQRGMASGWPSVAKEQEPLRTPQAWTAEDIASIVRAIHRLRGTLDGIPSAYWWEGMVRLALDTGERIRAVRSAQWSWMEREWINFPAEARKGGKRDRLYLLSSETMHVLDQIRPYATTRDIFPWPLTYTYLWRRWHVILRSAGLEPGRASGFHRLRKTVASIAYASGANPQEVLDHADKRTTQRYLDPRYTRPDQTSSIVAEWLRNPPTRDVPPQRREATG